MRLLVFPACHALLGTSCVCAQDYWYKWLAVDTAYGRCTPPPMTFANTRLLKVALLLAHAMSTYLGFTPPAVPPPPRDKLIRAPDFMRWNPRVQMAIFAMDRVRRSQGYYRT